MEDGTNSRTVFYVPLASFGAMPPSARLYDVDAGALLSEERRLLLGNLDQKYITPYIQFGVYITVIYKF